MSRPRPAVHPTSVVEPGARIGSGTKVWLFCHVMPGARIGRDCQLGQNVYVDRDVRIGDRVKIQNNVSIYTGVRIEDEVFLGPSCVFTNVKNPRSARPRRRDEYAPTRVKRGATVGANAVVVCGTTIGRHAFIGAGAVVTRDVPDYGVAIGSPATVAGWMCDCGGKIRFAGARGACVACGRSFRMDAAGRARPVARRGRGR